MKIVVVADVLMALQYNGVIRSAKKLDRKDFLQLSKAAKGYVIRNLYLDEKARGTHYHFLSQVVVEAEFPVKEDSRKRRTVEFDFEKNKIVRLPDGNGVLRVTPISKDGPIDYESNYTKGLPGSEWLYCTKEWLDDTDELIYMFISNQIRLFGNDKASHVEMMYVSDDDDIDIPEDVVWAILNNVLGLTLKVVGFPVDSTNDGNPNVQMLKSKLAEVQPV